MYLAIMLICVALIVFYNEINTKMNISEYILLAITLIAIIKASINYIQLSEINEGFNSNNSNNSNKKNNIQKNNKSNSNSNSFYDVEKDNDNSLILNSEDSDEYLDSDEIYSKTKSKNSFNSIDSAKTENKINLDAVKAIDDIIKSQDTLIENYYDIPTPTSTSTSTSTDDSSNEKEINSSFNPRVIIGNGKNNGFGSSGGSSSWNSGFKNDGFRFNNTMNPVQNLWRDTNGYYTDSNCSGGSSTGGRYGDINSDDWTRNMDDYNKGLWNKNSYDKPSNYVDYINRNSTSTGPTPTGTTTSTKKCGTYDSTYENQAGDLVIKDYAQSKKWVAGYTYVPPIHWDVPQKHAGVCRNNRPNVYKLTGLVDRGLPINALELNSNGKIEDNESSVKLTNVGSMLPKFNYQEQPFSKPYV